MDDSTNSSRNRLTVIHLFLLHLTVIVTCCVGDQDVVDMITNNMRALRHTRTYKNALVVVYVEIGNSKLVANRVATLIDTPSFHPVMIETSYIEGKQQSGVVTTDERKRMGTMHLTRELNMNSLFVATDLITQDSKHAVVDLANQMRSWRKDIVVPHDPAIGKFREVFTGKSSMGGKKDDRVICLLLVLYWSAKNHGDSDFVAELVRRGINI
jgi:hypothetical protein